MAWCWRARAQPERVARGRMGGGRQLLGALHLGGAGASAPLLAAQRMRLWLERLRLGFRVHEAVGWGRGGAGSGRAGEVFEASLVEGHGGQGAGLLQVVAPLLLRKAPPLLNNCFEGLLQGSTPGSGYLGPGRCTRQGAAGEDSKSGLHSKEKLQETTPRSGSPHCTMHEDCH